MKIIKIYFTVIHTLILVLVCSTLPLNAQKQGNKWYFGFNAAIDFNSGTPVAINSSVMNTLEGCASISDYNGILLFYTDGQNVYNKLNGLMPNGTGLTGGGSSTQSALIIPKQGSTTQYYLFTVPEVVGVAGLQYSIVDMSLAGGNGDVINKNTFLLGNVCEKLAGTLHANGQDVWITVHTSLTNTYYSYLVTSAGINAPVISNAGSTYNGTDYVGYLKFSPNGDKAAAALPGVNAMDILDFDNTTGIFSNSITWTATGGYFSYGIEFSATGNTLYLSSDLSPCDFYQFNMLAGSSAAIIASATLVHNINTSGGALQLGPDGKIYYNIYTTTTLGAFEAPDSLGLACNPNDNAVVLTNGTNGIGLPNYISNFFSSAFTFTNTCFGDTTQFQFSNSNNLLGVQWDFDDPTSGANNISFNNNPLHYFTAPGIYNVQAILYYTAYTDTLTIPVTINAQPFVTLGSDSTFCAGNSLILDPGAGFTSYAWQDGSSNQTFTATVSGTYYVMVSNGDCAATDSVVVTVNPCNVPAVIFSSTDTSFCEKKCIDFFDLSTNNPISWQWFFPGSDSLTSTLQNPAGICYNSYGSFDVTLIACNASGCDTLVLTDFINEYQTPLATITQSNDTLYSSPGLSYQWWEVSSGIITGATNNYFVPTAGGDYYVIVGDSVGCAGTSNVITITGINQLTNGNGQMAIVPNPNNGSFNILINSSVKDFSLYIINSLGQTIKTFNNSNMSQNTINVSLDQVAKGLYTVTLLVDNKIYREQFVKQ